MEQDGLKEILTDIIRHLKAIKKLSIKLNEQYGVCIINSNVGGYKESRPKIQFNRGIDESASALGTEAVTTKNYWHLTRDFKHNGVDFTQLPENHSSHFRTAFEKRKQTEIT